MEQFSLAAQAGSQRSCSVKAQNLVPPENKLLGKNPCPQSSKTWEYFNRDISSLSSK